MGVSDSFFRSLRLSDLTLRVRDLEAVVAFYRDTLGFRVVSETASRVALSASGQLPALIVLEHAPEAAKPRAGTAGLFHVAFLFPDRASLGRAVLRLHAEGVRFGTGDHGVSEAIYFSDPEDNGIEFYADRPVSEWPPPAADGQVTMYTEAVDLPSLVENAARVPGPWLSGETRIGHVHLRVSNLERAEDFYRNTLGFSVRQRSYPGALFLGRDGYHHHLAVNIWQSRMPVQPGSLGLVRFRITFSSPEERKQLIGKTSSVLRAVEVRDADLVTKDFDGIEIVISFSEQANVTAD